ncbi:hypothetical protein FTUN_5685 [Frigoriglobus tundricola]|uniref:Lipoprotein n=2 Tax=Frigoriglobus tundricola TaxID=2774151 RepID=A0A6M5YVP9_9BACT|nr:hypothetical protein FTUN_5685 [Frigoriglobus tundricola]
MPDRGDVAMTRAMWAGLAVCAVGVGCTGPQYYTPPAEPIPGPANVGGATVQIIDQRPEWEKKPFLGVVCLYHLGKAHPDAWAQLAQETAAVVNAMPQKPVRVDVVVSSFRLVRSTDSVKKFHDYGSGPNPNPNAQTTTMSQANADERKERLSAVNGTGSGEQGQSTDGPPNKLEMMFASKDDPRRLLKDHPGGASCAIQAQIRLVFANGQEQRVDVKTLNRGENTTHSGYMGEAMDSAARAAVFQFGRQFRNGVGLNPDQ